LFSFELQTNKNMRKQLIKIIMLLFLLLVGSIEGYSQEIEKEKYDTRKTEINITIAYLFTRPNQANYYNINNSILGVYANFHNIIYCLHF